MRGRCGTQALLAACAVLLLASCGGDAKSGETGEVAVMDVSGTDVTRAFDVGLPDTPPVTGEDASDDTPDEIDLLAHDMADAADVCIPDCEGMECGEDGCGGTCGECDDGDVCNGEEQCEDGQCVSGAPPSCADDNPCTLDECDPVLGCQHTEHDGSCNDDNPCTESETCLTGICAGGTKVVCDDNNPCTTDACSTVEGCIAIPNSAACNDGDPCTADDQCVDGACQPGENICFPCQSDLDCLQYDDGNLCNGLAVCEVGLCQAKEGSAVTCEQPASECLVAECDPDSGECGMSPLTGLLFCDDDDLCTLDDICVDGVCTGKPVNCQDGKECTEDWCDSQGGCVHEVVLCPSTLCSDGICDVVTGECTAILVDCNDSNPCTDDHCEPVLGCLNTDNDSSCSDGDPCTEGDTCVGGSCGPGQPVSCDDDIDCTQDWCEPLVGCIHETTDQNCDDDNPCTVDKCDLYEGCSYQPVALAQCQDDEDCSDLDPCTLDVCSPELGCACSYSIKCDDEDLCTLDICDADGDCEHLPIVCDDGDPCTKNECQPESGECSYPPGGCDDDNKCTIDWCNAKTGECEHLDKGCGCQHNVCEECWCDPSTGECFYTVLSCDDGIECTEDYCIAALGCIHDPTNCFE